MRHFAIFPILAALASSAAALTASATISLGTGGSECQTEMPCDWMNDAGDGLVAALSANVGLGARDLTNAQRLARGLHVKPPVRRWHAANRREPAPSGTPQPPNVKRRGVIQVKNTDNDAVLGYVSKNSFSKAQMRYQPEVDDALIVSFELPAGVTSGEQLNFTPENSDIPNFEFFGLVQGRDNTNSDLGPDSFHYGYMTLTNETPVGSTPQNVGNSYTTVTSLQRTSESAVWSWNEADNKISPQWINTDKVEPTTQMFTQSTALYVGGDENAFKPKYPAPVTSISLHWVGI